MRCRIVKRPPTATGATPRPVSEYAKMAISVGGENPRFKVRKQNWSSVKTAPLHPFDILCALHFTEQSLE